MLFVVVCPRVLVWLLLVSIDGCWLIVVGSLLFVVCGLWLCVVVCVCSWFVVRRCVLSFDVGCCILCVVY